MRLHQLYVHPCPILWIEYNLQTWHNHLKATLRSWNKICPETSGQVILPGTHLSLTLCSSANPLIPGAPLPTYKLTTVVYKLLYMMHTGGTSIVLRHFKLLWLSGTSMGARKIAKHIAQPLSYRSEWNAGRTDTRPVPSHGVYRTHTSL